MSVWHVSRVAWFVAFAAGLGGSSTACSKEESTRAPASGAPAAQSFRFGPPDGTKYVRIDRRHRELALVGAPLRRVDEQELTWNVAVEHHGDKYHVKQELVHISDQREGRILAKGKPPSGIAAELVIDRDGNLLDVKGLDKSAQVLASLVAPGREEDVKELITPDFLSDIVTTRYKLLFGDMVGRDATPGATWTINNPPGSFVASRTVTVTRQEACDGATCARLQVDFQLDPKEVAETATEMVRLRVLGAGDDTSKVAMKKASYEMQGSMLIEPATMLPHGAQLNEGGTVLIVGPKKQEVTVELKGTTEVSYSYPSTPAATQPAERTKPRVAAE